tara:strand:- start:342 stop:497 length:156 start_codon:yes stop_codon:yes gene_type:complete
MGFSETTKVNENKQVKITRINIEKKNEKFFKNLKFIILLQYYINYLPNINK